MRKLAKLSLAFVLGALLLGAAYGTVSIKMPKDDFSFKPGPGAEHAIGNCQTCHSAAYVYTQPPLNKAQWTAEVTKMIKAYGAPIAAEEVGPIVDYLMTQNGKP